MNVVINKNSKPNSKLKTEHQNKSHKIIHLVIAIVLLFFSFGNIKSINESMIGLKKLETATIKKETEKEKIDELQQKLNYVQTEEYLEREAFERFRYTKDGGTVMIIKETVEDRELETKNKQNSIILNNIDKWRVFLKL